MITALDTYCYITNYQQISGLKHHMHSGLLNNAEGRGPDTLHSQKSAFLITDSPKM